MGQACEINAWAKADNVAAGFKSQWIHQILKIPPTLACFPVLHYNLCCTDKHACPCSEVQTEIDYGKGLKMKNNINIVFYTKFEVSFFNIKIIFY